MKYALIGKKLGHSFSGIIHRACGLDYSLVELAEGELAPFVARGEYAGFNVTIPYKKAIMPLLDEIDERAALIGAVNTVVVRGGRTVGYNTDVIGLGEMIASTGVSLAGMHVVVLGSGGASATAQALVQRSCAGRVSVVSRTGSVNYQNVYEACHDAEIIINTTPVGMYPDVESCPVEVERFKGLVAVFDCVYNPIRTELVARAEAMGIVAKGGLKMLVGQALAAQKIWGVYDRNIAENTAKHLASQMNNLILSGMAGCGKSTIGRLASTALGKQLVDTDEEIFARTGKTPAEIITEHGEPAFRALESAVIEDVAKTGSRVIALGGGAVLSARNVASLKRNGIIIYLERDPGLLDGTGRPLSQAVGARALYERRRPVYEGTCDGLVINEGTAESVAEEVIKLV